MPVSFRLHVSPLIHLCRFRPLSCFLLRIDKKSHNQQLLILDSLPTLMSLGLCAALTTFYRFVLLLCLLTDDINGLSYTRLLCVFYARASVHYSPISARATLTPLHPAFIHLIWFIHTNIDDGGPHHHIHPI